ncbi:MAG: pentapeptide repeat-containing protein, partial [Cyanobacteria bacterium J06598_3]
KHPNQRPDLRGINLGRAYLYDIDLSNSILIGVNLTRACLIGANLTGADLGGAHLRGAYLNEADLSAANLSYADLTDAQVSHANFQGANLSGTCLASRVQAVPQPLPSQWCESHFDAGHMQRLQPTAVFDTPQFSRHVSSLFDTRRTILTAWFPALCR